MAAVPPQSFVPGSEWPVNATHDYIELAFNKLAAQQGFPARQWEDKSPRDGHVLVFECGADVHGYCPFEVRVKTYTSTGAVNTVSTRLQHNHRLDAPGSAEAKKHKEEAEAIMKDAEREIKKAIETRFGELKQADSYREGYQVEENAWQMSRAAQQERLIWDFRVAMGEEEARKLERRMRKEDRMADSYPEHSTLDGPLYLYFPSSRVQLDTAFQLPPSLPSFNFSSGSSSANEIEDALLDLEPVASSSSPNKSKRTFEIFNEAKQGGESMSPLEQDSNDFGFQSEHSDDEVLVLCKKKKSAAVYPSISKAAPPPIDKSAKRVVVPPAAKEKSARRKATSSSSKSFAPSHSKQALLPSSSPAAAYPFFCFGSSPQAGGSSSTFNPNRFLATPEPSSSAAGSDQGSSKGKSSYADLTLANLLSSPPNLRPPLPFLTLSSSSSPTSGSDSPTFR